MMKKLILALLLIPALAKAQNTELPLVNGEVTFEKVINVADATKDQIYGFADGWYRTYANNYYSTRKVDNKSAGQLAIKSKAKAKSKGLLGADKEWEIEYLVTFLIKDGRTKVTLNGIVLTDLSIKNGSTSLDPKVNLIETNDKAKNGKKEAVKIVEMLNTEMGNLFAGIEKALTANNF
jgi:hypothetical protein